MLPNHSCYKQLQVSLGPLHFLTRPRADLNPCLDIPSPVFVHARRDRARSGDFGNYNWSSYDINFSLINYICTRHRTRAWSWSAHKAFASSDFFTCMVCYTVGYLRILYDDSSILSIPGYIAKDSKLHYILWKDHSHLDLWSPRMFVTYRNAQVEGLHQTLVDVVFSPYFTILMVLLPIPGVRALCLSNLHCQMHTIAINQCARGIVLGLYGAKAPLSTCHKKNIHATPLSSSV